jgi:hypothetical protein
MNIAELMGWDKKMLRWQKLLSFIDGTQRRLHLSIRASHDNFIHVWQANQRRVD